MNQKFLILLTIVLNTGCLVFAQESKKDKIKQLLILTHQDSFAIKKFEEISSPSSKDYSEYLNDSATLKVLSTYVTDTSLLNDMKTIMKDTAYMSLIGSMKNIYSAKAQTNSVEIKKLAIKFINVNMVDLYDKKFSTDEIDKLSKFYKTNTGQKSLSLLSEIQSEVIKEIQDKYVTYIKGQNSR